MHTRLRHVELDCTVSTARRLVVDPRHAARISAHVESVTPRPDLPGYARVLRVHGVGWRQQVRIDVEETCVRTSTSLFGVQVRHVYWFESRGRSTSLALEQRLEATGLARPFLSLVQHVLTAPEHDGLHLDRLVTAAATEPDFIPEVPAS